MQHIITRQGKIVQDPPFIRRLFNDTLFAVVWLALRVWLGWQWVDAGLHKIDNPAWVKTGEALKGFWMRQVAIPAEGNPPISFDWYRNFLQFMLDAEAYTWFAKLVAYGEVIIGVMLILGLFTGIAALMGTFMNWNFMMAGVASTNPLLFVVGLSLVFAWKVAGYIGVDGFLLPILGTPWAAKDPEEVMETGGQVALQS